MVQSITDVLITNTWQSINTLSGITVGLPFELINKSNIPLLVWKGSAPTNPMSDDGVGIFYTRGKVL